MHLPIPNSTLALNIFSSLNVNFILGQVLRISFHKHLILWCVIKNVDLFFIEIWLRAQISQIWLLNVLDIHLTSLYLRSWCIIIVLNMSLSGIISSDKPSTLHAIQVPLAGLSRLNDCLAPLSNRWPNHQRMIIVGVFQIFKFHLAILRCYSMVRHTFSCLLENLSL